MFAGLSQIGAGAFQPLSDGAPREIPPLTPVVFPRCTPVTESGSSRKNTPLLTVLQNIHRPSDVNLSHFEALGLHVHQDVSPMELLPDPSFLPPIEEWNSVPTELLLDANEATKKPLNNGNMSPGVQTYREREKELSTDNTSAFRTIRRIPPPAGEPAARLGNAYEFFKNLEYFSGFWQDTSLPLETSRAPESDPKTPVHLQTHVRSGTGSQLPQDYRQNLLTAFVKLVAYDFGCNVSFPRCEPRLHLTPSTSSPPSYFNSSATFVHRTPVDRHAARAGIIEGPVAVLSSRGTTVFATEAEEKLDLAREVIAALLTAQQRAREHKREVRFGEDKWWTSKPRWGGGPGGPIGREGDKVDSAEEIAADLPNGSKQKIGGINGEMSGPSPSKRPRKLKDGNMAIYQPYRKMVPPSLTWDRKARYSSIGKVEGSGYDDIFLISALNHHVCIIRARVPDALLKVLDGGDESWDRLCMWRSCWFDMFLKEDRVAAMQIVWGVMSWLMRKVDVTPNDENAEDEDEKMDTS